MADNNSDKIVEVLFAERVITYIIRRRFEKIFNKMYRNSRKKFRVMSPQVLDAL